MSTVHPAEREEGRLKDEVKRMEQERGDLKEKMNIYEVCPIPDNLTQLITEPYAGTSQNTIFRSKQKIEVLKSQMNWGQQALEAWLEESARQDDDAITLAKYARADESKIKVKVTPIIVMAGI